MTMNKTLIFAGITVLLLVAIITAGTNSLFMKDSASVPTVELETQYVHPLFIGTTFYSNYENQQ
jgi:hypothetical protein